MKTKHHWLSQTYLKNFSPDKFSGKIYEIKQHENKSLLKPIKNIAFDYDYNTVKVGGEEKTDYEEAISQLESKIGRILKKLNLGRFVLNSDEWSQLLYYISYLRLNIPQFRKTVEKLHEDLYRTLIKTMASDKRITQNHIDKIELPGIDKSKIDIDELLAFGLDDGNYEIKVPKETTLLAGIQQHQNLLKIFARMSWAFYVIQDKSYFITTDMPIVPVTKDWKVPYTPGYGIADNVIFPVTKKICLVGQRNRIDLPEKCIPVNGEFANLTNFILMNFSQNHLYSPLSLTEINEQFNNFL